MGGGVSVSFECKYLGEWVIYNEVIDMFVIKGILFNFKD